MIALVVEYIKYNLIYIFIKLVVIKLLYNKLNFFYLSYTVN